MTTNRQPNTWHCNSEIADTNWRFRTDESGYFTNEQIRTATLVSIDRSLKKIIILMESLGGDGIHTVIRSMAEKVYVDRKRKAEKAKKKPKPKRRAKDAHTKPQGRRPNRGRPASRR